MNSARRSLIGTVIGGAFWGLSGTAAQALFQIYGFPVVGLVTIRMLAGGLVLLLAMRPSMPRRGDGLFRLFVIAIFGIAGSQLTYLLAIQYSNAPTGTLLQFLFLPIVAGYEAFTGSLKWSVRWTAALAFASLGTILLIGLVSSVDTIEILVTPIGLAAGLLSAVSGAYYSLDSRKILRTKGAWWLVTWGFIIGGVASSPFGGFFISKYSPPVSSLGEVTVVALVAFVIVFGTILSFGLYMSGLQRLSATETGIAASLEPIMAAVAAYFFLKVQLTILQYLGGALILLAVVLIASSPQQRGDVIPQI